MRAQQCARPLVCNAAPPSSRKHARAAAANGVTAAPAAAPALVALDPKKRIAFKLAEKHVLSHNVRRYRFALQSPQHKFGLPVGKHVFAYAKCAPGRRRRRCAVVGICTRAVHAAAFPSCCTGMQLPEVALWPLQGVAEGGVWLSAYLFSKCCRLALHALKGRSKNIRTSDFVTRMTAAT